jgi:hypothetical protein
MTQRVGGMRQPARLDGTALPLVIHGGNANAASPPWKTRG